MAVRPVSPLRPPAPDQSSGRRPVAVDRAAPRPLGVETPDADLVSRMLDGDTWAKEAFYRKHVDAVFRTALRLMRSRADADDVVQDAFTEAFRDVRKLREPASARGWLLRITVNRAHRRFRRRALRRALGLERTTPVALDTLAASGVSIEARAELAAIDRALLQVSTSSRIAWLLRYVEGHSLQEVAELTECSLATVKRRIQRAALVVQEAIDPTSGGSR